MTNETPRTLAREIAQAAHDKKGEAIVVLDLKNLASFTDYFVIATARSVAQAQAIAAHVEERLAKKKLRPFSAEGFAHGHWILLDYGSVVAHIFYEEERLFYGLERLWSDAKRVKFKLK